MAAMINLNKYWEATLSVKEEFINLIYLPFAVVFADVLWFCCCFGRNSYINYINNKNTTI